MGGWRDPVRGKSELWEAGGRGTLSYGRLEGSSEGEH